MLDGITLNKNERTKYFHVCMLNASYPKVKSQGLDEVRSLKPKHDYTSHYRSSFEYLCLGLDQAEQFKPKIHDKFPKKGHVTARGGRRVTTY